MKVDVAKLRNIIMPLVERAMDEKQVFSHVKYIFFRWINILHIIL